MQTQTAQSHPAPVPSEAHHPPVGAQIAIWIAVGVAISTALRKRSRRP